MMYLTNSEMQTFQTCPRKHHYIYNLCRITPRPQEPLYMGSAIGIGLDAIWENNPGYLRAFEDYLDRYGEDKKKVALYAKGVAMLKGYIKYWDPDDWELIQTEKKVQLKIDNNLTYRGMIDKVVRNRRDGCLYLIDHKTSSDNIQDPSSDYWTELMINPQATGYKVALEAEYKEEVRIIWDVIKKHSSQGPKLKKSIRLKKDETDDEFELRKADLMESDQEYSDRVLQDYLEKPEYYYKRKVLGRTSEDLKEWRRELEANACNIKASSVMTLPIKHTKSCRKYGRMCEYAPVCHGLDQIESDNYVTKENRHPELDGDEIKEDHGN